MNSSRANRTSKLIALALPLGLSTALVLPCAADAQAADEDEAIRVEVLDQEEIEEKLLMRPGNISMMLAETGGGKSYLEIGLLGEIVLGRYRLFLNLENLLDVRQTRDDPLVLPARAPEGSWTVDAWAPLEGFVANGGVRFRFGGS